MRIGRRAIIVAGATAALAYPSLGQERYPSRPVRMILPVGPGGLTDTVGRIIAEELSPVLGRPVVPENVVGAGSALGALALLRSPPDGYAIMTATNNHPVMRQLYPNFTQDPVTDFAHLSLMGRQSFFLGVHPDVPARNVPELLAWLRARGDAVNYGAGTPGTTNHMAGELMKGMLGLNFTIVPYRTSPAAVQDLIAGRVQMTIESPTLLWPLAQDGQVRLLGISSAARSELYPQVPTLHQAGIPGFDVTAWQILMARPGVPPEILRTLEAAARRVVTAPATRDRLRRIGVETWPDPSPEAAAAYMRAEVVRWAPVAARLGPA